jgi:hypothetical protein
MVPHGIPAARGGNRRAEGAAGTQARHAHGTHGPHHRQEWAEADNARRREMLAEFEVRVELHPTGHDPRLAITGMEINPDGFEMVG